MDTLWHLDPARAYADWQAREAAGADRRPFAQQSIVQHRAMFDRFNRYWGHAKIQPVRYHKPCGYIEIKEPLHFDISKDSLTAPIGPHAKSLGSGERRPHLACPFHLVAVQVD